MTFVNSRLMLFFPVLILIGLVLTASTRAASSNEEADAKAGAILYRDKGCAFCHGEAGIGTKKGPSLVDIRNDKAWPPEKMSDQILNGGKKMPPFRDSLSDDEIAQLVAYLRAKDRPTPPPADDSTSTPPQPH